MKYLYLLILVTLCCVSVRAQISQLGPANLAPSKAIASFPATPATGTFLTASDPNSDTDCTAGGGNGVTFKPHLCLYNGTAWVATGSSGTVTSVSVTTANGVSGSVATATTTPAISLTLGDITPTSVTDAGLTSGRVTVASTSGLLSDNAGLTFSGNTLSVGVASTTTGSFRLLSSASAFATTLRAGNNVAARTYVWPTDLGAAGSFLTDAAANGTLSWTTVLPVANGGTGLTALGTGIATALGVNVGSAGAPVLLNGALGSPSSVGTLPATTFSGDVTHSGAAIIISGNISTTAWTTSGVRIKGTPGTLTDTSSSGTVATAYTDVLGGNTIAASNATTFTNYVTQYVKDPVAGTNVTLTNKWAVGGDSARFGTSNQLTISNSGVLNATSPVFVTPALGSPSSVGTMPAFTLGGTIAGGGNQINNVIIGTTTPLAGAFTTLTASSTFVQTVSSATAHDIGPNGSTNPVLRVITNVASQADGVSISGGAAGAGTTFAALSSGSNSNLALAGKGTGGVTVNVGQTTSATTDLLVNPTTKASGNLMDMQVNGSSKFSVDFSGSLKAANTLEVPNGVYMTYNLGVAIASSNVFRWSSTSTASGSPDLILSRPAAATLQQGAADAASPVPQFWKPQSVVGGTSNTAGALMTWKDSASTGNAASGGFAFQVTPAGGSGTAQNTYSSAVTIAGGTGLFALPLLGTDATHTDASVCEDTTTHAFYSGSGTLGVCLGTSTLVAKQNISPLQLGLDSLLKLRPISFTYRPGWGYDTTKTYYGLGAEDVVKVLPQLVPLDAQGKPRSVDLVGMIPVLINAIVELQHEIDTMKAKNQ